MSSLDRKWQAGSCSGLSSGVAITACSTSKVVSGWGCRKAFDGITGNNNGWAFGGNASVAQPAWLQLDLGSPSTVTGLEVKQEFGHGHRVTDFRVELLTKAGLKAPTDLKVANAVATVSATENRVHVMGLPALTLAFAAVRDVTAVKISVFDTDGENKDAVLTEVTVFSSVAGARARAPYSRLERTCRPRLKSAPRHRPWASWAGKSCGFIWSVAVCCVLCAVQ